MADPLDTEPKDQTPRERGLARRSGGFALGPWLVVAVIALLTVGAYVASALF